MTLLLHETTNGYTQLGFAFTAMLQKRTNQKPL